MISLNRRRARPPKRTASATRIGIGARAISDRRTFWVNMMISTATVITVMCTTSSRPVEAKLKMAFTSPVQRVINCPVCAVS